MSKIVAIITEYNPFHNGHKYQIDKIKAENSDAIIIAIMSGNIVQRGEFAFLDKYARAEMALSCGVDAVFELPYPYSGSTAEIFAYGGVRLAYNLGADILYFGTESDNLSELEAIAQVIDTEAFENAVNSIPNASELSYPVLREKALSNLGYDVTKSSNDMLAIEYIRQIKKNKYKLTYRSIKRIGAEYNDNSVCDIMSASGIRKSVYDNKKIISIPKKAEEIFLKEYNSGKINDLTASKRMLYQYVIMQDPRRLEKAFDSPIGIGYYLSQRAQEACGYDEFFDSLGTRNFTTARAKRAILYSFFDVKTINRMNKCFTVLLATNKNGQQALKKARSNKNITVLTKHSDSKKLSLRLAKEYRLLKKVDEIYQTLFYTPRECSLAYKRHAIIEK